MGKTLPTLLFGTFLAYAPLSSAQHRDDRPVSPPLPAPRSYAVSIEKNVPGIFINHKVGEAYTSPDSVNIDLDGLSRLIFLEKGDRYQESGQYKDVSESYGYTRVPAGWLFHSYTTDPSKEARKDKLHSIDQVFPDSVMLPTDLVAAFTGRKMPDSMDVLVFAYPYHFEKRGERRLHDGLVEVRYEITNLIVNPQDKQYLDGPVRVLLKENPDGTHVPLGLVGDVIHKSWLLGPIRFQVTAREKHEEP
jgi:hypothetical protein